MGIIRTVKNANERGEENIRWKRAWAVLAFLRVRVPLLFARWRWVTFIRTLAGGERNNDLFLTYYSLD